MLNFIRNEQFAGARISFVSLTITLLTGAFPYAAQAQYRQEVAGRVGSGQVLRIFEGGVFDRCSASFLNGNRQMLRIAFNKERKYSLSIPQVPTKSGGNLIIAVSTPNGGSYSDDALGNQGGRAWRSLDLTTVEGMMGFRGPLIVHAGSDNQIGSVQFQWNLSSSVENVLVAIENCTNRSVGWR